jgi:hypothetical protein
MPEEGADSESVPSAIERAISEMPQDQLVALLLEALKKRG